MIPLLHENLSDAAAGGSIEIFAALCPPSGRRAQLRQWLGHDHHPDAHGKPTSPSHSISASHTPALLALAIRAHGRVGIDIETLPAPTDLTPLPQGLSTTEQQFLLALPPAERSLAFARLWTAREALGKAFGLGNTMDLSQIELHCDAQSSRFLALYGKPELAQGWTLIHRHLESPTPTLLTIAYDQLLRNP